MTNKLVLIFTFVFSIGCTLHYKLSPLNLSTSESSDNLNSSPSLTPDAAEVSPTLQYSLSKNIFSSADTLTTVPSSNISLSDFYVSPNLPAGLAINSNTGEISGSPTVPTLSQAYTVYAKTATGVQVQASINFEVAANFTVNSTTDLSDAIPGDGSCSSSAATCTLRAATEEANAQSNGITSIINIPSGTYGLTSQPLSLTSKVILQGSGRSNTIIDANPDASPISPAINIVSSPNVVIDGIAIRNAAITTAPAGSYKGIAIKSFADNIELKNCEISNNSISSTNNTDVSGVGLYHNGSGTFQMDNCNITNNTANLPNPLLFYSLGGGAYIISSDIKISNSNISNNTLTTATTGASKGGALVLGGGKSLIDRSVINNNVARNHGGAIWYSDNSPAEIKYTTLSDNSASTLVFGTFIYAPNGGSLSISNSTIYKSSGTGAELIYADGTQMNIKNSTIISTLTLQLIELNGATLNVEGSTFSTPYDIISFRLDSGSLFTKSSIYLSGNQTCTTHAIPVVSYGYNVFSDSYCNTGNNLDLVNTDPLLNALANNGGLTMTASTQSGSAARDLVPASECLAKDQRDSSRLSGLFCDAGAYQH